MSYPVVEGVMDWRHDYAGLVKFVTHLRAWARSVLHLSNLETYQPLDKEMLHSRPMESSADLKGSLSLGVATKQGLVGDHFSVLPVEILINMMQ